MFTNFLSILCFMSSWRVLPRHVSIKQLDHVNIIATFGGSIDASVNTYINEKKQRTCILVPSSKHQTLDASFTRRHMRRSDTDTDTHIHIRTATYMNNRNQNSSKPILSCTLYRWKHYNIYNNTQVMSYMSIYAVIILFSWEKSFTDTKLQAPNKFIWAASWQNQQNGICAQRRLRSAWASAQSDQSLRCPLEES